MVNPDNYPGAHALVTRGASFNGDAPVKVIHCPKCGFTLVSTVILIGFNLPKCEADFVVDGMTRQ